MLTASKPLRSSDDSAFDFVQEMLAGDPTYGINFDRLQSDSRTGRHVIVEYLLCEDREDVNPHTSHPNRYYWNKSDGSHGNRMKFLRLWEVALKMDADLLLVNYAKAGTTHQDKVKVMRVLEIDEYNEESPIQTEDFTMTRSRFQKLFRDLNRRGKNPPTQSSKLRMKT